MDNNIKILLKKWVKIDEEIKQLENKIKSLNSRKKKINPILENYMKQNNLNKININQNYNLNRVEKDYYKPINKSYIIDTLKSMIENEEKRNKIVNYIYSNRDIVTKDLLEINKII